MTDEQDDPTTYLVVTNEEEQYSIWREDQPIPAGWKDAGKRGPKAECLAHVEAAWTDMRPLSVRRAMASPSPIAPAPSDSPDAPSSKS